MMRNRSVPNPDSDTLRLGKPPVNVNQSGCCGGKAHEYSSEMPEVDGEGSRHPADNKTPYNYITQCAEEEGGAEKVEERPKGGGQEIEGSSGTGIDERTKRDSKEDKEARKARLAGGALAKSLLDDRKAEPLPPRIRRPGEPMVPMWEPPTDPPRRGPFPARNNPKFNEELEQHLNHLPFFTHKRYDRVGILKKIKRIKPLRGLLRKGRYYIDKDRHVDYDVRMDPKKLEKFVKQEEERSRKCRADGRINRIVDLFMDKVMGWSTSRELLLPAFTIRGSAFCFMWLGPSLAKKMLMQFSMKRGSDQPALFETFSRCADENEFLIINRLPVDTVFKDKENFYFMLSQYMLSPSLVCKNRPVSECCYPASLKHDCHYLEEKGQVTRRACVHQNLSMSLKPCSVYSCFNFELPVCSHLYAFIPETITLNSYTSMLHFSERFKRVEDLRGCIFITKPAYLCNGRGIKFIVELDQFVQYYHMLDGKSTTRHGVVLQRYVECPRLFDRQKFTIRFFLLIIVLNKRRVIGLIHYGLALFAKLPYDPVQRVDFTAEDEAKEGKKSNSNVDVTMRSIGCVTTQKFLSEVHLTNHIAPARKASIREAIFTGKAHIMQPEEDHAFYLEDILPTKCNNTASIYIQMLFVGQCIMDYMQSLIQDYPGTFQVISIDTLVDSRNKLWVLEADTNIFSGFLTIAPRQRHMMSAIIQESIGITLECFYKMRNNLPLYWDYMNECESYDAIYFSQDFNLFYETEVTKLIGYIHQKRPPPKQPLLEDRYEQVDAMRLAVAERKAFNLDRKIKIINEKRRHIERMIAKDEEES